MFQSIMLSLLVGAVVFLIGDRFFFPVKDKLARKAIDELAKKFKLSITLFDYIDEVSLWDLDYEKSTRELEEKINMEKKMRELVKEGDARIIRAVNALANHLNLIIEEKFSPEKREMVIVKKSKK